MTENKTKEEPAPISPFPGDDVSLLAQWDTLQSDAPEGPKSAPTPEQLVLLRAHKSRVKAFLAGLSAEQRAMLPSEKKRKRSTQKKIVSYFSTGSGTGELDGEGEEVPSAPAERLRSGSDRPANPTAEALASRLGTEPLYLTRDSSSWVIHAKKWMPSPDEATFWRHWNVHPTDFHELKLFGKTYYQNRWSQSWGYDYRYSGSVSRAREIREDDEDSELIRILIDKANDLISGIVDEKRGAATLKNPYNGCLQNWYAADHTIGAHSDDEKDLRDGFPIFSLSWGGPRRFVLKTRADSPSPSVNKATDFMLEDGDLLVMGGACQRTHKHEVPKRRVTKDPATSERINWTIRAFLPP